MRDERVTAPLAERSGGLRRAGRMVVTLLVALTLAYGALLLLARFAGRTFMYPGAMYGVPETTVPTGVTVLERKIEGGSVEAWFFPGEPEEPKPLVVLFHGNGELIDHQVEVASIYARAGYAVLVPEYRGYGRSGGSPEQVSIVADALWFIERAIEDPAVDPDRVLYHGFSIGGGVAGAVTRERAPNVLVLSSTFRSMGHMFARYLIPPALAPDPYDTAGTLKQYDGPVLITHGSNDTIVPTREGRGLARGRPGATLVIHPGGHNDALTQPELWEALSEFLTEQGYPSPL
ncbi:MAG: alpha/beta hydrolase [Planctomycetota bacterium]